MERHKTPTFVETVAETALSAAAPGSASGVSQLSSSSVVDEGRFLPGALLGGRYRIIGLLGRGGMGEVYRATDLALGQPVALKFLPEEASRNPRLLERFHGEVRVARLVSHPNVCRVFDIGEVDGTPFISMEYVDGEDLASLLTRIGRLPADKALAAARQLCAGLAAAHDRGVIHRDLKPQNIMINKRGDVVIMDFGLAAIADQLSGAEVRNGTPAYMAPEQLRGAGVTQASDLYALGLVVYELFTGKRPYEAKTLQQLLDLQESAILTSMTSIATDIDPAVEKVIRRCLAPDPLKRPSSALAVSAALPGGDPLAAALAAGETPSPELVANAGKAEGLARKYSIPCLAVVVAVIFASGWATGRTRAAMRAPVALGPEVLAHVARQTAASLGYTARPADSEIWMEHRADLVRQLDKLPGPKRWEDWFTAEAPYRAIYRESPSQLIAKPSGVVEADNPPVSLPGMTLVTLDGNGHLRRFVGVPGDAVTTPPVAPEAIFRAAGLEISGFEERPPTLVPEHASDTIRAWQGPHPALPNTTLLVQAAFWKGRVSEAVVTYPWNKPPSEAPRSGLEQSRQLFVFLLPAVGTLFAALAARHNWRKGRTDRKGAFRIAAAMFLLGMLTWMGTVHAVPSQALLSLLEGAAGDYLLGAIFVWLLYLAIEPAIRARYPHAMVTWNRLLAGRWMDSQVAADVLIGAALGCALWAAASALEGWKDVGVGGYFQAVLGTRQWLAIQAGGLTAALQIGLIIFAMICFLRRLVGNDLLTALATALVFTLMRGGQIAQADNWMVVTGVYILIYGALAFVLVRLGLVTTLSLIFYIDCFSRMWFGSDWKAWYAPSGFASVALMLAIAGLAFWKSLGSQDLLGGGEEA